MDNPPLAFSADVDGEKPGLGISISSADHHLQTINHRRVVQEVYDRQVLHRMLGVTPKGSLRASTPVKGTSQRAEAESVAAAWGEASMIIESSDDKSEDELAESRYEIESRKQPPKKRRRTGTRKDEEITVYTTDEDEDGLSGVHQPRNDGDGISEEEEEYDLSGLSGKTEATGNRRSYWLSKAMAANHDSGDE